MLREERTLVKRLIEQTKKNQIRWHFTAGAFGGYEFSSDAGSFVVEWLQDDKPTLSVRSGGETFLFRNYFDRSVTRGYQKTERCAAKIKNRSRKNKIRESINSSKARNTSARSQGAIGQTTAYFILA